MREIVRRSEKNKKTQKSGYELGQERTHVDGNIRWEGGGIRGTGRGLCMSTINPVRGEEGEGRGEEGGGGGRRGDIPSCCKKTGCVPLPPFSCPHIHIKVTVLGGMS
jgi:hypothetical protein